MKRGDSYSVRYKYKDHSGKPCEGWESFKTKKEAQERKITVEKELLDGTFLVPDTMTVEEMLYKWIPIQSTKHKWSPKTYTQSVAMVQNLIVPYIGKRKVQELRTYDIEKSYAHQEFPRIVFHGLRHSSATYQLMISGGDVKAVQGTTGHATADMLVNTYAHIQQSSRVELGRKFEEGFYAKQESPSPQAVPAAGEPTISMTALLELLKNADPEVKAQLRLALLT